jgi:hypothetical protein
MKADRLISLENFVVKRENLKLNVFIHLSRLRDFKTGEMWQNFGVLLSSSNDNEFSYTVNIMGAGVHLSCYFKSLKHNYRKVNGHKLLQGPSQNS